MTDLPPPDPTEELLRGADRPRPLPPELRQRLADRLVAATQGEAVGPAGARPLPSGLRARLEDALPSDATPEGDAAADGGGEPVPRAWRWVNPLSAVAAVLLIVAAVVGLSVHGGGSGNRPTAASSAARNTRTAAGPQLSASSPSQAAGTGGGAAGGSSAANGAVAPQLPTGGAGGAGTSVGTASPAPSAAGAPLAPAPSVSGVSPATGPTTGGTWVTVTGQNLGAATQVRFGTTVARRLVVVSATEVRAESPAHALGTVDVTVVTPGGTSAITPPDRYTFLP